MNEILKKQCKNARQVQHIGITLLVCILIGKRAILIPDGRDQCTGMSIILSILVQNAPISSLSATNPMYRNNPFMINIDTQMTSDPPLV